MSNTVKRSAPKSSKTKAFFGSESRPRQSLLFFVISCTLTQLLYYNSNYLLRGFGYFNDYALYSLNINMLKYLVYVALSKIIISDVFSSTIKLCRHMAFFFHWHPAVHILE